MGRVEKSAAVMALQAACSGIEDKRLHTHTRATKAVPVLFFLCDMKVGQVVTTCISNGHRKRRQGWQQERGMREEKGGPRTGLRS